MSTDFPFALSQTTNRSVEMMYVVPTLVIEKGSKMQVDASVSVKNGKEW